MYQLLNVHYGDILVKFGEVIDLNYDALPAIVDESILKKYSSSLLQDGDVVIADAAEDETVGKCSEIKGCNGRKVLSGLHTIPVRTKQKFACGYLGYYMNSSVYHDQLLPLMQGTKVSSISKTAIQETNIIFPICETEQEKIGNYFQQLDHLITLHQRKYFNPFFEVIMAKNDKKYTRRDILCLICKLKHGGIPVPRVSPGCIFPVIRRILTYILKCWRMRFCRPKTVGSGTKQTGTAPWTKRS